MQRYAAAAVAALVLAPSCPVRADDLLRAGVTFRAGEVEADTAMKELSLRRNVVITYGRYRMDSDALDLAVRPSGIFLEGRGRVAFCPCPDPPFAIAFDGARVAPPGDLVLRSPRLELEGVPVAWLPWIWLRAPDRSGLLPPSVAWRGPDGLALGAGIHVPWRNAGEPSALDLRGVGYSAGGAGVDARVSTPATTTRVTWDEVRGRRVAVDARGSLAAAHPGERIGLAWDVDAIRGGRARSGTIELLPAALPDDHATAAIVAQPFDGVAATGAMARGERGRGPAAVGPVAALALGGPIGRAGTWEASGQGFVASRTAAGPTEAARALIGAELDARPGPFDVRLRSDERVRVVDPGGGVTPAHDALASAWAEARAPFVRTFAGGAGDAPLAHAIAPVVEGRFAGGATGGARLPVVMPRVPEWSWIAAGGLVTSLDRYAGPSASLDVRGGAIGVADGGARPALHARIAADQRLIAAEAEGAVIGSGDDAADATGAAARARVRLGAARGLRVAVDASAQGGGGAAEARGIAAGARALPGEELGFFDRDGVTGGAEIGVPWTRALSTAARADADVLAPELLAISGGVSYRHPCGCFVLDLGASRRIGRSGVDVWLTLDLAPPPR